MNLNAVPRLLKASWDRFSSRKGPTMAAAIAYRAVFALAPLLLVVVSLVGAVFGDDAARGLLVVRLAETVGIEIAEAIQEILATASSSTTTAGVIGLAVLVWAGSGLFLEVQSSLSALFEIEPARLSGIRRAIIQRLKTLAAVLGCAIVLALLVGAATIGAWLPTEWAGRGLALGASAVVMVAALASAFRYLTVARLPWPSVLAGALITAVALLAAALGVGMFIARGGGGVTGIAGSVVAVLFAVYILSNVTLLGAAFTKSLADSKRRAVGAKPLVP